MSRRRRHLRNSIGSVRGSLVGFVVVRVLPPRRGRRSRAPDLRAQLARSIRGGAALAPAWGSVAYGARLLRLLLPENLTEPADKPRPQFRHDRTEEGVLPLGLHPFQVVARAVEHHDLASVLLVP